MRHNRRRFGERLRIVVTLRTGIILNAERYADGTWETRVRVSQSSELSRGQRNLHVRQIAVADVLIAIRTPVSGGDGGNSPLVEDGTQSDHGV